MFLTIYHYHPPTVLALYLRIRFVLVMSAILQALSPNLKTHVTFISMDLLFVFFYNLIISITSIHIQLTRLFL